MRKICSLCHEVISVCDECFRPLHEKMPIICENEKHFCMKCSRGQEENAEVEVLD